MRKVILIGISVIFCGLGFGQNDWMSFPPKSEADTTVKYSLDFSRSGGSVNVYKDDRLDLIQDFTVSEKETVEGVKIDGFRVLIFFDQDKTVTQQQKAHFISLYPDHKAYIDYLAPNYRVRVGNFRTKLEAEALKVELLPIFPTSIVIKDKIQLPELPQEGITDQR